MLKKFFSSKENLMPRELVVKERVYNTDGLAKDKIPKHVAIIMDGNGRWAKNQGKPRTFGHYKGAATLKNIVIAAQDLGIEALTAYAFSTENWKRPRMEVDILMSLLDTYLTDEIQTFRDNNTRVMFSGDMTALSPKLQEKADYLLQETQNNTGLMLNLAINYGSRAEIVRATKNIAAMVQSQELSLDDINENLINSEMYTANLPEVDLLIRPGGDLRISNFLLWQIAYAEIWLTKTFWPDFTPETLIEAIRAFQSRDRRFGGLNNQ